MAPATLLANQTEWFITMQAYMKNVQLLNCNSHATTSIYSGGASSTAWLGGVCYGMNVWMDCVALANMQSPSTAAQFTELHNNYCYYRDTVNANYATSKGWAPLTNHNDGFNVSFADGHVKWRKNMDTDDSYQWGNGYPRTTDNGF